MQVMQNFSIEHFIPIWRVWNEEFIQDMWLFSKAHCTFKLCMIFICKNKKGWKGIIGISINLFVESFMHAVFVHPSSFYWNGLLFLVRGEGVNRRQQTMSAAAVRGLLRAVFLSMIPLQISKIFKVPIYTGVILVINPGNCWRSTPRVSWSQVTFLRLGVARSRIFYFLW